MSPRNEEWKKKLVETYGPVARLRGPFAVSNCAICLYTSTDSRVVDYLAACL